MTQCITVPATLPGVVIRGTPLVQSDNHNIKLLCQSTASDEHYTVVVFDLALRRRPRSELAVNLEDATGRAHVAWTVAAALGSCQWEPLTRWESPSGATAWSLSYGKHLHRFWSAGTGRGCCGHLDWDDPTRLPDGSLRVDALALRAIALEVLGGAE